MPSHEELKIAGGLFSTKGLFIAFLGFLVCFAIGWAWMNGYLTSGKGAGSGYEGVGASIIAFLMFTLLPLVFGIVATVFLGGPYDSYGQRVLTLFVFLAVMVVWNLWLYFGGGFDFFYYD